MDVSAPLLRRTASSLHRTASEFQRSAPKVNMSALKKAMLRTFPIIFVHMIFGTIVWHFLLRQVRPPSEAFYFAVVTFLTIGYGDISPASPYSKAFFMLYIVLSLVVQLTTVTAFISAAIEVDSPDPDREEVDEEHVNAFLKIRPRLLQAACCVMLLIALTTGSAWLLHTIDNVSWLNSFYWALTTLSTVGYGDIVPHSHHVIFALCFLVSCVVFEYLLGLSVSIAVEVVRIHKLGNYFKKGLTEEMIKRMDTTYDDKVSRWEFLIFMLKELDLVDDAHLNQMLRMFDALDLDGDGSLSRHDIYLQQQGHCYDNV